MISVLTSFMVSWAAAIERGHAYSGDLQMSEKQQAPETLKLASSINATAIKVRLSEILLASDHFFHRDPSTLEPQSLQSLMDNLVLEKMQEPVEGFFDSENHFTLVQGYRRVAALRLLAEKNTPNFSADMDIDALILDGGSHQDHLVRSVSGNSVRNPLTRGERIRAAKRMHDAGVEETRAAAALGVSVKTYQRDLLIAKQNWMFEHVNDNNIEATAAIELLEAGQKHQCLAWIKEDFAAWVAKKKELIRDKDKLRKLKGGKELTAAEKQVKRLLVPHLLKHWLELIEQGKRFDDDAEWDFIAGIDQETNHLHIAAVSLDLDKDSPEKIAKVLSKCSLLSKQAAPDLAKRLMPVQSKPVEQELYDLDYLKEIGAGDIADRLKARTERSTAPVNLLAATDMENLGETLEGSDDGPATEVAAEESAQEVLAPQPEAPVGEPMEPSSVS